MKRGNTKVTLTSEQQVCNAVIVCVLNVVENNISFNSCDEDNDLYRHMFPDSNIAKNYFQGCGKSKVCNAIWYFSLYQGISAERSSRPAFSIPF